MWLYMIAAVLLVVGLVGGVLTGGIFLIIFIPLGVIAMITAIVTGGLARRAERGSGAAGGAPTPGEKPLPTHLPQDSGHVTSSPEALVDARRQQQ